MAVATKITGIIKTVFPVETFGNFTKQVIWIEEVEQSFNNTYEVEFIKNRIKELEGFKSGDLVEIEADVQGRYVSKNGKEYVFNSISGWKIVKI